MNDKLNKVLLRGTVNGKIIFGKTKNSEVACSFGLAIPVNKHKTTWIRVNAYGELAEYCTDRLQQKIPCYVSGELMSRDGQSGSFIEVLARELILGDESEKDFDTEEGVSHE